MQGSAQLTDPTLFKKLIILAGALILAVSALLLSSKNLWSLHYQANSNEAVEITDFQFHHGYSVFLRHNPHTAAYQESSHYAFMKQLMKGEPEGSLSFGYSPTLAFLYGWTGLDNSRLAWIVWILASLTLFLGAVKKYLPDLNRVESAFLLVVFASPAVVMTLYQGQTALLTTGIFLWLATNSEKNPVCKVTSVINILLLVLLTIKPPLALCAGCIMLTHKNFREVFTAALIALIIGIFWTLRESNLQWVTDYLSLVNSWNKTDASPFFGSWIWPETMSNLRGVLYQIKCSDRTAFLISKTCFGLALIIFTCAAYKLRSHLSSKARWTLGLLIYLLFCPHLSATEDLAMIAVFLWLSTDTSLTLSSCERLFIMILCSSATFLLIMIPWLPQAPLAVFMIKAAFLLGLLKRLYSSIHIPLR
ncbi:MAG: hypothetical protein SH807_04485 [Blastochloris sp.]|nr:hypothetical protein [Blastochloris sp.]